MISKIAGYVALFVLFVVALMLLDRFGEPNLHPELRYEDGR